MSKKISVVGVDPSMSNFGIVANSLEARLLENPIWGTW